MLERLVHDQLISSKSIKSLPVINQLFKTLCFTITSLINCTDYWYDNMDNRKINLAVFLDLKKALDTVDHSVLINKLRAYGIRGFAGDWFESYLMQRKQYCAANGHRSNINNINCGIPRCFCLGPFLFIIYLNDFEKMPRSFPS